MKNHHAVVLPPTGRPIQQGVDGTVCDYRGTQENVRTCFHRKFNLGFYFTALFFFNAKCKVYKHNTVSQRCTFMQMTSSIYLLHAAAQCKSKLVQLHVTPGL